jgi:hypothetical protein
MSKKHMKNYVASLAIKEMQIKTMLRLPYSCLNSYLQEHKQQQILKSIWRKRNPHTLLLGM